MRVERDRMIAVGAGADDADDAPLVIRELRLIFPSSLLSVRRALRSTLGGLAGLDLSRDEAATVELALAEVLNNVVEHAYDFQPTGLIEFRVRNDENGLACTVFDDGTPMPEGKLPLGRDDWDAAAAPGLPEGGFGWYLIRALAEDLRYERVEGRNALHFRLPVGRAFRTS